MPFLKACNYQQSGYLTWEQGPSKISAISPYPSYMLSGKHSSDKDFAEREMQFLDMVLH